MVEGFRLSPQQRRLWLLQQGDGAAYRARCAVLVEGVLDERALRDALVAVVKRHQILGTTFRGAPGISLPVQVIDDGGAASPRLEQLAPPRDAEAGAGAAERFAAELFANAPPAAFDFERGPLVRAALAPAPNGAHVLLLELPALCADTRSLSNLVRDLARLYAAREDVDGEEPTQYVQFSEWQNELLEEPEAEGAEFWRQRDYASLPALALPRERRDGERDAFTPAGFTTDIDPELFARVEAAARRHRARPDAFLLACWQTLLWRLTGQDEPVVGVAFDGRKYEELYDALGLFAKTVPVYADFSRPQTFAATLKRTAEAAREADLWQEYFEPGATPAGRRGAHAPAFLPVHFGFEEQDAAAFEAGRVRFTLARHESIFDRYKLKLTCRRTGATLRASFGYDAGALREEDVRLVARCFVTLLASAAGSAEAEAGALDITAEEDWRRVRAALTGPRRDAPPGALIHELFEEIAARTPDETAVVAAGRRLSYAQLNVAANRIAHFLRRHGVGPDSAVGLCVERSPEMIAGLLGVLKAGGAYVPLDPELPESRLAHQLADASVRVLVTQQRLRARFPNFEGVVLDLDDDAARLESESPDNPRRAPVAPGNLAYVIYTSGSTGTPKGVGVTHGGLSNYTRYLCERLGLPEAARQKPWHFAVVSTISADLGNTCIFPSLVSGGCLHVVSYEAATDAEKFADYLAEHAVDVLKIVPSHLGALLEPLEQKRVFPRRYLLLGGEALPFALARRLPAISGGCRLVNHYGPTETTVGSMTFDVGEDLAEVAREATTVPVGHPIANTRAYILDARLRPVPEGVGGELYIGGDGLARGYLNRAGQTADRFVPDPFADEAGARMYRTGDVARLLSGGAVEFLGRVDHQVKVRGYRIELGEIESALREHASVREAVAVAREDESGQKRLVAYCVPLREPGPTAGALRDFLANRLPPYMLPAAFVTLKALPLTPNGKVNRGALPDPGHARPDTEAAYAAPRGPVEETLAGIWKEVLGLEEVGRDDNFFELGGDSIISIQIVARANRAGLRLDPRLIFEHPTVAQLAKNTTVGESAVAEQGEVAGPVPLTPIQHWFFERGLSAPEFYTQSLMLEARQPLDAAALGGAVAHLLRHHDALRMRYTRGDGGVWHQHNAGPDDRVPFTSHDLSGLAADEQRRRVEEASREAYSDINLSSGPLVRVAHFDRGPSAPALLLLVVHHLVVDGVSWRVLTEDLQTVYGQLLRGALAELPAKTTSFKRWAERLADYARSEELTKESDYWLGLARQLAKADGAARLPRDDDDGANTLDSAQTVTAALSAEETRALLQRVPEAYRTQINDALLAALADSLAAWVGARGAWRLPVSLEGHGREAVVEDADVTRTVGWFTSRYPVVLERGEGEGAGEALRRVKEMLRAVPGRGVGYGVLRHMGEDARTREELNGLDAAAEVSFNYLGQFDQSIRESSLFKISDETPHVAQSSGGMLSHLLRVNAQVVGGRLEVMWTFSENIYRRLTVEKLAESYLASLRALIAHCLSREATSYTPADFPDAGLTQKELDLLVAGIGGGSGRDNLEDVYALSPMQEAMLFQTLYDSSPDAYFRQLSFRLHGRLDAAAFRGAWRRAVEHHATLRTSFFREGVASPVQVVHRHVELPLEEHDWRGLAPDEREARLEAFLASERGRAFDLARAPLVRLALLRLEDELYQFVWSYHHLLMDGWSRGLINRDVLALYEADRAGRDLQLTPPRPYREYIRWLGQASLDGAEAFWRRTLAGFDAPTTLPLGRVHAHAQGDGDVPGDSTALVRASLSAEETEALLALTRRQQLTPGTLVQGAWALLLARLSGSRDVVFGTVVSGRPAGLHGSEEMVGLFINTLPVRARLTPDEGLMTWLGLFQRQLAELREYEHSPLSRVQRWSGAPQGGPLFHSTLNFGNYFVDASLHEPRADFQISGAHFVERIHQALVLAVEMGPTVRLSLLYDGRLYGEREATLILESFVALLGEMVADPEQTLSALLATGDTHGDARATNEAADEGDDSKAQFAF
ncbi:MAG: amino acid adenylation domain-containing protein [Pyrinomonadaceae bacterium]